MSQKLIAKEVSPFTNTNTHTPIHIRQIQILV